MSKGINIVKTKKGLAIIVLDKNEDLNDTIEDFVDIIMSDVCYVEGCNMVVEQGKCFCDHCLFTMYQD